MPETIRTPLRRDAERNRRRILEAARTVFAEHGFSASFDDIAREADVAVGTVYRRFPSRQELIDALFVERMEEIVGIFDRADENPDAWEGFVAALDEVLGLVAADRGLWELMMSDVHGGEEIADCRQGIAPRGEGLLRRAQEQGAVRPDLEPSDVPLLKMMLGSLVDATRDVDPEVWRRFLTIVLDGIRAKPRKPTPLPRAALPHDQVECVMRASVRSRG